MWLRLFEWWAGLPWWARYGTAMVFLLISTGLLLAGKFGPWGWGIGGMMLLFGGQSESEKKGYKF
jgi:hypothetical protein